MGNECECRPPLDWRILFPLLYIPLIAVLLSMSSFLSSLRREPPHPVQTLDLAAPDDSVSINLEMGDPVMFERYWGTGRSKGELSIRAWEKMSYFSSGTGVCWFMEPKLEEEIVRLHALVGNAATAGKHVVVGIGSSQLFQAALFALSPPDAGEPIDVVTAAPFYSFYQYQVEFLRSGLYRWAGDARTFQENGTFIEVICMPNNPDGFLNQAVLSEDKGRRIHDLAYYWPQYTPITYEADHEIMLFTLSKLSGHGGTRIGWALVKDADVAEKMTKFIMLNTLGVSKDSQLRAAKIMKTISYSHTSWIPADRDRFFDFSRRLLAERWRRLRDAVEKSSSFILPTFPSPFCLFSREKSTLYPAFAWMKCVRADVEDCELFFKSLGILARGGEHFGADRRHVRISMLPVAEVFDLFIEKITSVRSPLQEFDVNRLG